MNMQYNWKNKGGFEGQGSENEVKTRQMSTAEDNMVQMTNNDHTNIEDKTSLTFDNRNKGMYNYDDTSW